MTNALDTLIDAGLIEQDIIYDPSMFFGADANPLGCLAGFVQLPCGDGIGTADAASLAGVDEALLYGRIGALDAEILERAAGRLALAWLRSVRARMAASVLKAAA
jgi:hypothetical protein